MQSPRMTAAVHPLRPSLPDVAFAVGSGTLKGEASSSCHPGAMRGPRAVNDALTYHRCLEMAWPALGRTGAWRRQEGVQGREQHPWAGQNGPPGPPASPAALHPPRRPAPRRMSSSRTSGASGPAATTQPCPQTWPARWGAPTARRRCTTEARTARCRRRRTTGARAAPAPARRASPPWRARTRLDLRASGSAAPLQQRSGLSGAALRRCNSPNCPPPRSRRASASSPGRLQPTRPWRAAPAARSFWCVFDGHNGVAAASMAAEHVTEIVEELLPYGPPEPPDSPYYPEW